MMPAGSEPLSRRSFIRQSGLALSLFALPAYFYPSFHKPVMKDPSSFEVIIIGGSYSGLAAGMALGRSLRRVLIIDSGKPCNQQTSHSHNFLTQDGTPPGKIAALARQQVEKYETVQFFKGLATQGRKTGDGFEITVDSGETFYAKKLIFASGIKDLMPEIKGFSECWGISVLHCPYCHGYEVRNKKTGILGNGELTGFDFPRMISHWTKDLILYTNGASTLTPDQTATLQSRNINIVEKEIERLEHTNGHIHHIVFKDGSREAIDVMYGPRPFEQHCKIPEALGCELTEHRHLKTDGLQKTTVPGVFACGDNATGLRTVANAVSMGAAAGMMLNKDLIFEGF
jgi:thioredoxin reductase